jgi:hypothetical protein
MSTTFKKLTLCIPLVVALHGCYLDVIEFHGEQYPVPVDGRVVVRESATSYASEPRYFAISGQYFVPGARIGVHCETESGDYLRIGEVNVAVDGRYHFPGPAPSECVTSDMDGAFPVERITLVGQELKTGMYVPLVTRETMDCALDGSGSLVDTIRRCSPGTEVSVGPDSATKAWGFSESIQPVHKLTLEWRVARSARKSLESRPLVGTMFYDMPAMDSYLEPLAGLQRERDISYLQKDSTNLMVINGLSSFDFGQNSYNRVPWQVFLRDCNGKPCTYRQLRDRIGSVEKCKDSPHEIETAGEWLCHMDGLRDKINRVRDKRKLHIYGHLVNCTLENICGASGEPLLNLDGTHPREFLNAHNHAALSVEATAQAYGRLSMFLAAHYEANFFTPWRELNRLAVFRNVDLSFKFRPAYREIVGAIGAYDPTVAVFVSWLLEKMFDCEDTRTNTRCQLSTFGDGREHTALIAEFWKMNRESQIGEVPTLIAFSTYPQGPVEAIVDATSRSASNLNTVLDKAGSHLPGLETAFQLTGLAITETGFRGWQCIEFTDPYITQKSLNRRYEDEQAIFINHLVNYQYSSEDVLIHPMVFINNWWLSDIEIPVQEFKRSVFGPLHATHNADLDRWITTQSGLFTSLVGGRTPKAAYSSFTNAIDPDRDKDGVKNITFSSPTTISSRDNCPLTPNHLQIDSDADGRGDACDNCPTTGNFQQWDFNLNGVGNACDTDTSSVLRRLSLR